MKLQTGRPSSSATTKRTATVTLTSGPASFSIGRRHFHRSVAVTLKDPVDIAAVVRTGWFRVVMNTTPAGQVHSVRIPVTGRGLASWRTARRMTQAAASLALGVCRRTWIRNERRGYRPLTFSMRAALLHHHARSG